MGRLSGRVTLVTGSGRGIGRAIAVACAREGARIGLTSRMRNGLDAVAAEVQAVGSEAHTVAADLMDRAAIKQMVGERVKLQALTHDDNLFEKNLFLNLTSTYYATRVALPQMVKQDYGRVIFIGSGYAKRGGGQIAYTAAKHGLVGMTLALAYQVPMTITVNTLCPGWTNTSLVDWEAIGRARGTDAKTARVVAEAENVQRRILETGRARADGRAASVRGIERHNWSGDQRRWRISCLMV